MDLSLKNKTALVCGSTRGIGLAAATALAGLGATCVLMARNESALRQAVEQLDASQGQQHTYLVADLDFPDQTREAITPFIAANRIDILVNNAGGPPAGALLDAGAEDFITAFNRLLISSHILARAVVPAMKQSGYGRIINIVSTSVKVPIAHLGVSNTIRGAVAGWSKTLANELGTWGITVNNVLPGLTQTQRLRSLITDAARKQETPVSDIERGMLAQVPAGRFAAPEEVAGMVAFLATPAAAYINGTSIRVDGGKTGSI